MFDFNACIDDIGKAVIAGDRKEAARLGEELYNWVDEHVSNPYLRLPVQRAWSRPWTKAQAFAQWPWGRWGTDEDEWKGEMTPRDQEYLREIIVKALKIEARSSLRLTPLKVVGYHLTLADMLKSLEASGFNKAI